MTWGQFKATIDKQLRDLNVGDGVDVDFIDVHPSIDETEVHYDSGTRSIEIY